MFHVSPSCRMDKINMPVSKSPPELASLTCTGCPLIAFPYAMAMQLIVCVCVYQMIRFCSASGSVTSSQAKQSRCKCNKVLGLVRLGLASLSLYLYRHPTSSPLLVLVYTISIHLQEFSIPLLRSISSQCNNAFLFRLCMVHTS